MFWYRPATLWNFLRFVYRGFMRNQGLETAKSLTYTSLFAVVPLITLVFAVLSAVPSFQVFGTQIQEMIFDSLLPSSSEQLERYLANFSGQARNLTWVGAVMLLVTSYLMLVSVERNFNLIWGVQELRKGMTSFLLYWSVLSLGPLLLGIGFAISSYVTSLSLFERFTEVSGLIGVRRVLFALFPLLLTTGAFTLLYVAVPNCGVRIRHGFCGALVVALSFMVVKVVFTRFIATASYELIYGTFAAVPIFLLWIYVGWVVILLGANLVRGIPLFAANQHQEDVHPSLLLLALMHRLWEKQQSGATLRVQELMDEGWPLRTVSAKQLFVLLGQRQLVQALDEDEYLLARDLSSVSLWDLLSHTPWAQPGAEDLDLAQSLPRILQRHLPEPRQLRESFIHLENVAKAEFSLSFADWFEFAAESESEKESEQM
ncbi:MAG: YihY family inner membrane protein [Pseudomonadales bacterium]|jgi:membrane protein|nr:YihY family inner membrane protein [Pseudomonadales bacterium]